VPDRGRGIENKGVWGEGRGKGNETGGERGRGGEKGQTK